MSLLLKTPTRCAFAACSLIIAIGCSGPDAEIDGRSDVARLPDLDPAVLVDQEPSAHFANQYFELSSAVAEQRKSAYRLVSTNSDEVADQGIIDSMELSDSVNERLEHAIEGINDSSTWSSQEPSVKTSATGLSAIGRVGPRDANTSPDQFRVITESEMLSIALAHSPVLRTVGVRILESPATAATSFDPAISASDPFLGPDAALAEFDQVLSASLNSQNNDRVFNNATLGGQVQELTQDLANFNTGIRRRTMSGATLELNSLTGYDANNRAGNRFPNYWETQLEAGVRQPLLRGAGREFNRIAGPNARPGFNFSNGIVIARMNTTISQYDFEIALRTFVRELYQAYWELVRQYQNYDSVVKSRDLSYETWQTIRAKGLAELEGGEANKEAQSRSRYYSFRREAQVALGGGGGLYVAERQLRQLMGLTPVDGQLLKPADKPVEARYVFDFDHISARAMAGRTELRRQSMRVQQQRLRLTAAKNFMLPQLDLIGRYRVRGFGDDLFGSGARFDSAFDDFRSADHQEWEFGVEMGVVQGRRQARAAVRNARLQLGREQAVLVEQQRVVRHQVSNAHAEVASSYYAMESSLEQVKASRQRLEASEALYEADKIQIEFLLDAQEELLRAESQLATDQSRYSLALVDINTTSGTLLQDIGVIIQHAGCGSSVHYAPADPEFKDSGLLHEDDEFVQDKESMTHPDADDIEMPRPPTSDREAIRGLDPTRDTRMSSDGNVDATAKPTDPEACATDEAEPVLVLPDKAIEAVKPVLDSPTLKDGLRPLPEPAEDLLNPLLQRLQVSPQTEAPLPTIQDSDARWQHLDSSSPRTWGPPSIQMRAVKHRQNVALQTPTQVNAKPALARIGLPVVNGSVVDGMNIDSLRPLDTAEDTGFGESSSSGVALPSVQSNPFFSQP